MKCADRERHVTYRMVTDCGSRNRMPWSNRTVNGADGASIGNGVAAALGVSLFEALLLLIVASDKDWGVD